MKDIEVCFVVIIEEIYEYFFEYSRERERLVSLCCKLFLLDRNFSTHVWDLNKQTQKIMIQWYSERELGVCLLLKSF